MSLSTRQPIAEFSRDFDVALSALEDFARSRSSEYPVGSDPQNRWQKVADEIRHIRPTVQCDMNSVDRMEAQSW